MSADAPPCPYCGERQAYDEARPSKPMLSEPRRDWQGGRMVTVRDTIWHTHCRACGERIVWSVEHWPNRGVTQWSKPSPEMK